MKQQGNVLFIVLIGIALFGALTATVMRTENIDGSIDNETLGIQLYELTEYAGQIEQAVASLMVRNGCALAELSFDHPDRANYNTAGHYLNPNSPAGNTCHVFETEGGGVPYKDPIALAARAGATEYGIASVMAIEGLGRDPSEVGDAGVELTFITQIPKAACLRLNREKGISNPSGNPPNVGDAEAGFLPVLGTSQSFPVSAGSEGMDLRVKIGTPFLAPELNMKKNGCYSSPNGIFYFYHVLLTR